MNLIIISGSPATGKTTIGKEIIRRLGYEYLSKDIIKEALYDTERHSTWDYSWYEKLAKNILFKEIEMFVVKNQSVVVESNFVSDDKHFLNDCLNDLVQVMEIYCVVKGLTSFRRFVRRNENGVRHKGHHDRRWYPRMFFERLLNYINIQWPYKPISFNKKVLIVDTTDFSKVNYDKITKFIVKT